MPRNFQKMLILLVYFVIFIQHSYIFFKIKETTQLKMIFSLTRQFRTKIDMQRYDLLNRCSLVREDPNKQHYTLQEVLGKVYW